MRDTDDPFLVGRDQLMGAGMKDFVELVSR